MSAIAITPQGDDFAGLSPRVKARFAAFLYLIIIVGGIFAQIFVRDRLVVSGDPASTARNIMSHDLLYRLGFSVAICCCAARPELA